ncbi:piggyBac transposable element-derived protein 4-like protein [Lates japonicus]|uniref:PiggyBac transposable element-derived protein 4-like protein n=1 Tax=Lates japonicus TaxID=270547 RepID=A0AAD3MKM6_LATJO|nr:piggyBac transposable element-derived protein 4-like protein [Lates japonicus]
MYQALLNQYLLLSQLKCSAYPWSHLSWRKEWDGVDGPLANCECPKLLSTKVRKCADATPTIHQVKLRKDVSTLSSMHMSVGVTDRPKAKLELVTYYKHTKINAHILFKECASSRIAWRKFMQQLSEELRAELMEGEGAAWQLAQGPSQQQKRLLQQILTRRQCQVHRDCT